MPESPSTRVDPRRARTRAALISAAQELLAQDRANVAILEITELAGIGLGSFYNHFQTKEELFDAAVDEVLETHGHLMDRVTEGIDDPAEVFARAFRLTGRLHRHLAGASQVLLHRGAEMILSERGLGPRALRDIKAAQAAGRFTITDPEIALVVAGGAMLGLGSLLHSQPERDAAKAADDVTVDLLRMFGVEAAEAREICSRPLPDVDELLAPPE
jgi:AcrR family transcriptional regulator